MLAACSSPLGGGCNVNVANSQVKSAVAKTKRCRITDDLSTLVPNGKALNACLAHSIRSASLHGLQFTYEMSTITF